MHSLGFKNVGKDFYHDGTDFTVECPGSQLVIGNSPMKPEGKIEAKGFTLRLLSPTQCVMDRPLWWQTWVQCRRRRAMLCCKVKRLSLISLNLRAPAFSSKFDKVSPVLRRCSLDLKQSPQKGWYSLGAFSTLSFSYKPTWSFWPHKWLFHNPFHFLHSSSYNFLSLRFISRAEITRTPAPRIVKQINRWRPEPVSPKIPNLGSSTGGLTCSPKTRMASACSNTCSASRVVTLCFWTLLMSLPWSHSNANAFWFKSHLINHSTNLKCATFNIIVYSTMVVKISCFCRTCCL